MGTYTTNYQLYTPTVGETGWGTLVNGNFTTIDTTMKSLSNRITAVENEVNGALSCTSVTTSGKVTGNGGIAGTTGTFSGAVMGDSASFNTLSIDVRPSGTLKLIDYTLSKNTSDHGSNKTINYDLPEFKGGTLVPKGYYIRAVANQNLNYTRTITVTYNDVTVKKTIGQGNTDIVPETYLTDLHNFSANLGSASGVGRVTLSVYAYI